jgi:CheY-like chemotaxis protein
MASSIPHATGGCRSILVVEDEPEIRTSLKEALEWEGYDVVAAANGREALECLHGMERPCLILLDLMMPVMNGWEFAEAVRADDVLAANPIIIITAFTDEAHRKKLGTCEVVRKPVNLEHLLRLVKRHCGPWSG